MVKEKQKSAGISDEAVRARTGKGWEEWFAILDAAGAVNMGHKEIVAYLVEHHEAPGWWQQMIAVTYEQARGLREKHETPSGYQVSASKTVGVPVAALFQAWQDEATCRQWLPDAPLTVRKATLNRSMRISWAGGQSNVDVNFYARGDARSQVAVEHSRLADSVAVERMRAYWTEALGRLKALLETG